ncbi:MAG: hypothetical protein A2X48_02370 [Lentisphaerae bacterium GWF2_49_21]|nr:MAG: hypothetical protein A2X48_02370 [Lentisphaerae bacterium GWF2_49_21]
MQKQTMKYRDWLNLSSHLLWCYEHRMISPPREMKRGKYNFTNNGAWLVHRGWAQVKHDGKIFRALPGQWLIVKPVSRSHLFAADTVMLSVAFDAHWPDGSKWIEDGLSLVINAEDHPLLEKRARPMARIMKNIGIAPGIWNMRDYRVDSSDFFALERHLNNWFAELLKALSDHGVHPSGNFGIDERVARAVAIMNNSVVEENFDMHKLSAQIGISLVHLVRLFQKEMNRSPKAYFEDLRLRYAMDRLNSKGERINEVANALGFAYLSNFSNWFRKHTGMSPRNYIDSI